VAARKARGLLECGAVVTVIAPDVCAELAELTPLTVERRPYAPGDAAAHRLVITATGIPEIDGAVYADADAAGVWVNSADDAAHCSLILPAVHRDGAVTIAVSTGGSSPALASWLRIQLAGEYGPEVGQLAEVLGRAREGLRGVGRSTETVDWMALLDGPLLGLARQGRWGEVEALIEAATATPIAPPPAAPPPSAT
jgi:precorrin-2 dehydrogenase / sirohydrochlorin ferrochelatase